MVSTRLQRNSPWRIPTHLRIEGLLPRRMPARHLAGSALFLVVWWRAGGTYSWIRDLAISVVVPALVVAANPESRTWIRRVPRRARARLRLLRWQHIRENSDAAIAGRAAQLDSLKTWFGNSSLMSWLPCAHSRAVRSLSIAELRFAIRPDDKTRAKACLPRGHGLHGDSAARRSLALRSGRENCLVPRDRIATP